MRRANGSYPFAFEDVPGASAIRRAACAVDGQGILHVCAMDACGTLWHTVRLANGQWPHPFGNIQDAAGRGIGPTPHFARPTHTAGDFPGRSLDNTASPLRIIPRAGGKWPKAFCALPAPLPPFLHTTPHATS